MASKLTLKEIAEVYRVSPKTFRKYLKKYSIPHEGLGRNKRFDLETVRRSLTIVEGEICPTIKPVVKSRRSKTNAFAEALGL
jgi:hypothetical protein